LEPDTAAVAIILDGRENVLLVRAKDAIRYWGPPGGHVEPGEDPADTAVRETCEETSLTVRVTSHIGRYEFGTPLRLVAFAYACVIETGTPVPQPDEIAEIGWYPASKLPQPMENIGPFAIPDAVAGLQEVTRNNLPYRWIGR
jgi:ADP-ribose pyrophosphatase YjhB (NUDIX family)